MFNITNKEARNMYQRIYISQMVILERLFFKDIKPILTRHFYSAARLLEWGIVDFEHVVINLHFRVREAIEKNYMRAGNVFSKRAFDSFDNSFNKSSSYVKDMRDEYQRTFDLWVKENAAEKVVQIGDTTRNAMKTILDKGKKDGKSYGMIAKDLRTIGASSSPVRAMKIARTEIHTASVKSTNAAVYSTRVEMEREWCSTIDDRTRPLPGAKVILFNHRIADGERIAQDAVYTRTGESLRYPGDSAGSAGNIINCRCCELFFPVKRVQKVKPTTEETIEQPKFEKVLQGFEDQIKFRKTEKAVVLNPTTSEVIVDKSGSVDHVSFTSEEISKMKGMILTHNHPSNSSFSPQDIDTLVNKELKEIRTVSKKHLYVASIDTELANKEPAYNTIKKRREALKVENIIVSNKIKRETILKINNGDMTIPYANEYHFHFVWEIISERLPWLKYKKVK